MECARDAESSLTSSASGPSSPEDLMPISVANCNRELLLLTCIAAKPITDWSAWSGLVAGSISIISTAC